MTAKKTRMMYMHTLDGKPASYTDFGGTRYLWYATGGHRVRAASLVSSLTQIRREQQHCIASDWREWNATKPELRGARPTLTRYGYVLVEVPL